jgi:hypothetical protein
MRIPIYAPTVSSGKRAHRQRKQVDAPVLHIDLDVPGKLWGFRLQWKMAVRELEYFFATVSQCPQDQVN